MSELYVEPIKNLDKIYQGAEMSEGQLGFLCGLIKQKRPKKILEIGVAAGGTTAIILNCISMLNLDTEVSSIDVDEKLYYDNSKYTGYLTEQFMQYLTKPIKRTLYTNGICVEFLETIGKNIDFLILDTVHSLPGELLDFLACLPFLSEKCTVVLHDIELYHLGKNADDSYATQILYDSVVGKKITANFKRYPNIGAFEINEDTRKYVENVFHALMLPWHYIPSPEQMSLYRNFYCKYYDNKYVEFFDKAYEINEKTLEKKKQNMKQKKAEEFHEIYSLISTCAKYHIYVYGCGKYGQYFNNLLLKYGIDVGGYIISDGNQKNHEESVQYLSEINIDRDKDLILIGVSQKFQEDIKKNLEERGIKNYLMPNTILCKFVCEMI